MRLSDILKSGDRFENGAWIDNIPECGDVRLKVRGVMCEAYRLKVDGFMRARSPGRGGTPLTETELQELMITLCRDVLLLGWENVTVTGPDDVLPYSPAAAAILLEDSEFTTFREAVVWAAGRVGFATPDDDVVTKLKAASAPAPVAAKVKRDRADRGKARAQVPLG